MASVKDIVRLINAVAPECNAIKDGYDNVGLIVGKTENEVSKVLCCLDVTEEVLAEAIELDAQMIIAHHPMLFMPTNRVTDDTVLGRKIITAIESGIAIYAAHTSLDFTSGGINDYVAKLLRLENSRVMDPYISDIDGLGRVGDLAEKKLVTALKEEVEKIFSDAYVRVIGEPYDYVSRVAVINGAGGGDTSYVDLALDAGADCLITADLKHHVAVYAKENGITVIEPQHYTMEHVYISELVRILDEEAQETDLDVTFIQSEKDINPRI
ncbi:MAG: Nif3-like dinuclear metal center hexameric protein [Clostridia bacterium]|nr:Nif3-like dinuclear metal center hexameric protein [Clostridia bacterium]MBQ7224946.1 Nif3-like dinuclear metal center hexameric protein [Clostridia bacterium]